MSLLPNQTDATSPSSTTGAKANVLVIGSGGREHALCWKLAQSDAVKKIYCAPGNGGTANELKTENVTIAVNDFAQLRNFAKDENIALTIVGPDDPLAEGIVDFFLEEDLAIFGPTKAAAQLEWSKAFGKQFMTEAKIPTPRYIACNNLDEAIAALAKNPWARVVKADGLALGKGVFVCDSEIECTGALKQIFEDKIFGKAGNVALIEEKFTGEELSLLLFCDGKDIVAMPASQDHKRRFDDNKGPNTGGMGVYSPVALYEKYKKEILANVIEPLKIAIANKTIDFKGILYAGLLIGKTANSADDTVQVLEFNARFGDPETQALMPLLQSDLYEILNACVNQTLNALSIEWRQAASCCVIAATSSYPQSSSKGEKITIGALPEDVQVFHAGTKMEGSSLVTNGGRVLAVTAVGKDMEEARRKAYDTIEKISFKDISYRKDIGRRAVKQCLST